MVLVHKETLGDYVAFVEDHPEEAEELYKDLLIQATSFFREPETFEALSRVVFPPLIEKATAESPLRIWVPGCATGEEVYSLGITLFEFMRERGTEVPVKIFGTDLSAAAVGKARAGCYSSQALSAVSPERRDRFWVEEEGGYRIRDAIRDLCVFARQDAVRDAPFSNIDLVSCRNLLIYLAPGYQKQALTMFHYALKASGFLMLGRSESVSAAPDLFKPEDLSHGIYCRLPVPRSSLLEPSAHRRAPEHTAPHPALLRYEPSHGQIQREADRIVQARYAPAGVIVDEGLKIMQFRGNTGAFLAPAPGRASLDLLKMAREGLLPALQSAADEARRDDVRVRKEGLLVRAEGRIREVNLEVSPLGGRSVGERFFLVIFEQPDPAREPAGWAESGPARESSPSVADSRVAWLEQQLLATTTHQRAIIEEREGTNEDLQAANEELQAANEEILSSNEELQTTQEELQATNEELITLNEELEERSAEASRLGSDLTNLLASTTIPVVMVTGDLRIRRFTPSAGPLFNLLGTDVGRSIMDINVNVDVSDLEKMLRNATETFAIAEREVRDSDGHWYKLSVRPYRTVDSKVDGAVITLDDIDGLKRSEQRFKQARDYAENILTTVRLPLLVLDGDLRVHTANRSFHRAFRTDPAHTEGRRPWDLANATWDPALRQMLETMRDGVEGEEREIEAEFPTLGRRILRLNGKSIQSTGAEGPLFLLSLEDITARKQQAADQQELQSKLQASQRRESLGILAGGIAHDFNNILTVIRGYTEQTLADTPETAAARPDLEAALSGCDRAADLCNQMLAYSGKGHFVLARVNVNEPIESSTRLLSIAVSKKAVLSYELAADLKPILADTTQIHQVIMNLVMNASEAIGDQPGVIRVETGSMVVDQAYLERPGLVGAANLGEHVFVEVADDGCGMTPETLAHIFEPFFTTKFTGRGLGLAAVLGIVRGHGGALLVDSEVGKGSKFRLLLPVSEGSVEDELLASDFVPKQDKATVLIVDDESTVRGLLRRLLEREGHEAIEAQDGTEAAKTFIENAQEIDLVLLDLTMPGQDGWETLSEIRGHSADVPVIMMSGYSEEGQISAFEANGAQGFLRKPFSRDGLLRQVAAALEPATRSS